MSDNEMCGYRNHSGIKVYYKVTEVQCLKGSFWFITSKGLELFTESLHSMISAADCVIAMLLAKGLDAVWAGLFGLTRSNTPQKVSLQNPEESQPPQHTHRHAYIC